MIGSDSFLCTRPQPSSRFMHSNRKSTKGKKEDTQILTWKPKCGEKPRQPTSCRIHYERMLQRWKHRGNDLLHLYFTTRRLQWRQQPLSLSLYLYTQFRSVHIQLQKCSTTINCFCPKSYLYTYDFRAIYTYGPKGLT